MLDSTPEGRLIEIYFSIVQRKVLSPNDLVDLPAVEARLLAFQERYEATAKPIQWKFTRKQLNGVLERMKEHERLGLLTAA